MEGKELDFATKEDLFKLQQDIKMLVNTVVHQEIEQNNETLMVKIEEKLLSPVFNQIQRLRIIKYFRP